MPPYAIRSAHVLKNLSTKGSMYIQIHGTMDCDILRINCTQSSPGAYDDGGQYDNGPYESCGKEPYSGVDNSSSGNTGFQNYVEQAGDGIFCMRVCEPGTMIPGGVCDVTHDTIGCSAFMGVTFTDGFTYTDMSTGEVSSAFVSFPSPTTTTSSLRYTYPVSSSPNESVSFNGLSNGIGGVAQATSTSNERRLAALVAARFTLTAAIALIIL
ncbi:hypothetical protein HDU82_000758 [Entophlyctis luteolus]|nr:hypothetical protein HDU82_000758 [Entophlyctis luteolus]